MPGSFLSESVNKRAFLEAPCAMRIQSEPFIYYPTWGISINILDNFITVITFNNGKNL